MSRTDRHTARTLRPTPAMALPACVGAAYTRLPPIYDLVFGAPLNHGRIAAIRHMAIRPGDRILEVGAGTAINAPLYPRHCRVTAIDISPAMLDRARARLRRLGLTHVELLEQDAATLPFRDDSFDRVYAPYVMSVVPDPVRVAREMRRVCRPGGRIVILNHFRSAGRLLSRLERTASAVTVRLGFTLDLDLRRLLQQACLRPLTVHRVNFPPMWRLVTCVKD